ncbi:MAG: asparagine synthase-related protein, partial [Leptolyngbyaceae cyanobacterium bins.59]|nr:asparagine synthase-related protein [Leptolyngbyaceae cyanobacterium bins.59]
VTQLPVQVVYPFFDLRLIQYFLAIPPLPWCVQKSLLRVAMRGRLPNTVLCRPKSPMRGDPLRAHLSRAIPPWLSSPIPSTPLQNYVDLTAFPAITEWTANDAWMNLRPLALARWLRQIE